MLTERAFARLRRPSTARAGHNMHSLFQNPVHGALHCIWLPRAVRGATQPVHTVRYETNARISYSTRLGGNEWCHTPSSRCASLHFCARNADSGLRNHLSKDGGLSTTISFRPKEVNSRPCPMKCCWGKSKLFWSSMFCLSNENNVWLKNRLFTLLSDMATLVTELNTFTDTQQNDSKRSFVCIVSHV